MLVKHLWVNDKGLRINEYYFKERIDINYEC